MVHNFYYKCRICNTKFRLRWQASDFDTNVILICPKCNTKINGKIKVESEKIKESFSNLENYVPDKDNRYADYVAEISSEFLCKKMKRDVGVNELTPFMRNSDIIFKREKISLLIDFADKVKKYANDLITAYDLYNNLQYVYLGTKLKEDTNPFLLEIKKSIKKYRFVNQIDYLMGIHQYSVVLLTKSYTNNTFDRIRNASDGVIEILKKHHNSLLDFVKHLNDENYFYKINVKFAQIISDFLFNYRSFLPLYIKECKINESLEEFGITTLDYQRLENFYKKAFEFLCDYMPIIIGLNNIVERNDFHNFATGKIDFKTKMNEFNSKYQRFEQCIIKGEKFSSDFADCLDNILRNSEAHFSTEYDALTQMITFKNVKRGHEKICSKYLVEFGIDVIEIFQKCIILWEYAYQLNKIYLIKVEKQKLSYKIN